MFRQVRRYSQKITELPLCLGEIFRTPPAFQSQITVHGWVRSVRVHPKILFIDLNDGTTHRSLNCVVPPELANGLQTGESLSITGILQESRGKQEFELKIPDTTAACKLIKLGPVPEDYPLQKKNHTNQFLRTLPHLRWRTLTLSSVLRCKSEVETLLMKFFIKNNFTKVSPPLITGSDCEGGGELFKIESDSNSNSKEQFFGKNAFLTVSTQLHLEVLAAALGRVWTLTPCFRAEESDTNRHLSEFWMLELEMSFVEDVHQVTKFSENMIKSVVGGFLAASHDKNLLESRRDPEGNLKLTQRWEALLARDWDNITYTEAVDILQKAVLEKNVKFNYEPVWGNSLQSEHEKYLAGVHFQNPVFVTDYPKDLKPFYMKLNPDGKTVACFDLLAPEIGELIGGSLREHDPVKLKEEMIKRKMNLNEIDWYLSLRDNGTVPHGGFGMGFERLICFLTNTENIKDSIAFPRFAKNLVC